MGVKSNPFLSSINSGEFSPRMESRVDFDRYPNAAKMCRNLLLLPQGGMTRRPGTRFVKEVKDSSLNTVLMPFQFSESDAYVLEAGNLYMRFYRRQARLDVANTDVAITNGTFGTDPFAGDWTNSSASWDNTNFRVDFDYGDYIEQSITVAAGDQNKLHVLRFEVVGQGAINCRIHNNAGTDYANRSVTEGYHTVSFTPTGATLRIRFTGEGSIRGDVSVDSTVDNVSILDNAALELVTPYATADLDELRTFQAADVIYILHQDYHPRRLERHGTYDWSIVKVDFTDGPWLGSNVHDDDLGVFDPTEFQLVDNPFFENGLVGWEDTSAGDGQVFSTSNGAELDPGTSGGGGDAELRVAITPISNGGSTLLVHFLVVNQAVKLSIGTTAGGVDVLALTEYVPGWHTIELANTTGDNYTFFTNTYNGERSGVGALLVYQSGARLIEPSATTGSVTLTATGFASGLPFSSDDVGRLMRLSWPGKDAGYGIITAYSSATSVTMLVLSELGQQAPTEDWAFGAFGGAQGYPKTMGFFDGRTILANTPGQPQTFWTSQSGDVENMRNDSFVEGALTVEDDDGITATLQSKRIDPILWLADLSALLLGTAGAQWSVSSSGSVITPSDIFAKVASAVPAGDLNPAQISQAVIFADRSKRELHEVTFSNELGGYIPELLTILAEHIFRSPVHQIAFQRRPEGILWCPREDGRIATLAYNRAHEVLGWSQQIIGGTFGTGDPVVEHIAIIPGAADDNQTYDSDERDEVWLVVKRTINGSTKRYIEFIETEFDGVLREDYDTEQDWWDAMRTAQKDAFYVDSGITYSGASTATITGLSHLEGQTVKVWADGKEQPEETVSGGQITITDAATKVQVGLGYTHRYLSLKMSTGAQLGTAVNKVKAITGCGVVVLDTGEFDIAAADHDDAEGRVVHDLQTFDFRFPAMTDLRQAVPLFSGESYKSLDSNWSPDPRIYIESDAPAPFTLIGLAPHIEGTDET